MDSEQSAFAAAQMRHHRYMYFGKKQRYIEVFQCSGEDMSLVLSGGIPVPTAPVSPVGKTLISSGMLNAPTILPTAAAPNALTAATASLPPANGAGIAAAGLVQQPAGLAAWDPFAALQMQQVAALNPAHVHAAATYRTPQDNVWLQLFAQQQLQHHLQQQMQLAALAQSQKPQWADFNGAAAAAAAAAAANQASFMQAFPPPPPLTPVQSAVVTSQAGANSTSAAVQKSKSLMPSTMFPVVSTALHIPQAAGVVTSSASNQPFVLINIPRVPQSIQSYPAKMGGVTSTSTVNHAAIPSVTAPGAAFNMPQNALISPTAQYAASSILKRSWEHAFTDGMAGAPGAVNVKRPYSIGTPANSTAAIFTVPPPQQSPAQISAQPAPPAVAFQPPQFFAPT